MSTTTIRRELKRYIDAIPEHNLEIIRPMLSFLAGQEPLVIETGLTDKEKAIIKAGTQEYKKHPEKFTDWTKVRDA